MGSVPVAPSFVAGEKPPGAKLTSIKTAIDFLQNPPKCLAVHAASQTLTTNVWTRIDLTSEIYDIVQSGDSAMHDVATDPSRIYIRTAGKYEISAQLNFVSNATGARQASIGKNGAGVYASAVEQLINKQGAVSGIATSVTLSPIELPFSVGDYLELFGHQTSGGNLATLTGAAVSYMRVKWVGV